MSGRWPFVGRIRELTRVETLLSAGVGTLVIGEPGVGKSALVGQISSRAAANGTSVARVLGHAVSSETPFEAFAGLLAENPVGDESEYGVTDVASRFFATVTVSGKRSLLVVDDVQLIDDRSAQVLLQIAATNAAIVVATAPSGTKLVPAVERLWRDGWCERIELEPLSDDDVASFLTAALGGQVDANTIRTFANRSNGNTLFLRELVAAAVDQSRLVRRDVAGRSAWTLVAEPPVSGGIREAVAARLADLSDVHREALELVAAGEPLKMAAAADLVGEQVMDELAAARLVVVRDELGGPTITTAHPMYGDVLRADMSTLRLHRLRLQLAQQLEDGEHPLPHDLVRAAVWRLDGGQAGDTERVVTAARAARRISLATAERLARHAYEVGGSLPAALLLAEILTHTGRTDAAAELTSRLPPESLRPEDRAAIVYCAALGQGLMSGDPGAGADLVAGVLAGIAEASDQLRALYAALLAFDARFDAALDIATPILADRTIAAPARTLAAVGAVGAAYWLGRYREAVKIADQCREVAASARDVAPFGLPSIELIAICALAECGDLDAAQQRAELLRRLAQDEHDAFAGPRADYCLGRIALMRGQPATAQELFAHCLADHAPFDSFMERHLAAMFARAAAACGDVDSAAAALDRAADKIRMKTYDPQDDLAEAAVLASSLRMDDAAERAAWAAGVAVAHSAWNVALVGYHDAARYGAARQVVRPMREVITHTDAALPRCYHDHVVALATNDAAALDEVGRRFESHGVLQLAAEAAAEAALAHAAANDVRAARASSAHAARLLTQCEADSAPWLTGAATAVALTARERQVAALAASGWSDAAIAEHLRISIRTVQTHLGHIYDKLGSAGRGELAIRLADHSTASEPV